MSDVAEVSTAALELGLEVSVRNSRHGVAFTQALLGNLSPETYRERCKKIDADFKAASLAYFCGAQDA